MNEMKNKSGHWDKPSILYLISFSGSFRQDIGQISTWEIFIWNLVEKYLFMKNSTDFHKTVETGVDLRLLILSSFLIHCNRSLKIVLIFKKW